MSPSAKNDARTGYAVYKFIVSLLLLGLAAMAAIGFLVGLRIFEPDEVIGNWATGHQVFGVFDEFNELGRVLAALFAAVMGLLFLAILQRMWSSPGQLRTATLHILDADDHGRVWVDSHSVAVVARQAALSVRGVIDAQVRVSGYVVAPVEVNVEVEYYPGTKLKDSGVEVRTAVRSAVEDLVGLQVRNVEVRETVVQPEELTRMLS
ncbi:MAG: alkaline shock response membrane anchor protein AmaP [Proteobacteria bacterium]|nr:alkaline shock response membrane anchor protein AmaP [Pseudomonadota bacterium]